MPLRRHHLPASTPRRTEARRSARTCHRPRSFRPCRSSRLRRLSPLIGLRVCCAPQPTLGFTRFWTSRPKPRRPPLWCDTLRSVPLADSRVCVTTAVALSSLRMTRRVLPPDRPALDLRALLRQRIRCARPVLPPVDARCSHGLLDLLCCLRPKAPTGDTPRARRPEAIPAPPEGGAGGRCRSTPAVERPADPPKRADREAPKSLGGDSRCPKAGAVARRPHRSRRSRSPQSAHVRAAAEARDRMDRRRRRLPPRRTIAEPPDYRLARAGPKPSGALGAPKHHRNRRVKLAGCRSCLER